MQQALNLKKKNIFYSLKKYITNSHEKPKN